MVMGTERERRCTRNVSPQFVNRNGAESVAGKIIFHPWPVRDLKMIDAAAPAPDEIKRAESSLAVVSRNYAARFPALKSGGGVS